MTPINFALPGFFKKASGFDGIQEDLPPITDDLSVFFDPDYAAFSDEGNTLAADGDYVRQVWDRSSTGNTAEQTSASLQPLYDTSEFGNGNASLFTGSYDSFDFASSIVIPDTSGFTFHTVYKKDVLGDYSASIGNRGGEDSAHINHRSSYVRVSDDSNQYNWNSFSDDTTLKIISIVVDRSANTISVYKNGELSVSNSITYSDTFTFRTLFAHSGIPGTNTYWGNQLMYEGAHSADQVLQVSEWLGDKYDILVAPITENLELYVSPDKHVYSDAGTTLATDDDSIRQINDLSGNDNTLEQATASYQYKYIEDHFGTGKSAFNVLAYPDHMDFANTLSIDSATTGGITFYSVYDKTNLSSISYLFGTTDGNFNRILEYGNHSIYIQDTNGDSHFASITDTHDLAIRAFTLDTSTDTIKTYDNGVLDGSSYKSKTWGTFNFDNFWGAGFIGYVGDTLLFSDVHDADQVLQMTNWLDAKYDIIPKLPVTSDLEAHFAANSNETYSNAGTTLATDGDNIAQINDISGNNNHLTQTTAANQLVFKDDDGQVAGGKYWKANSVDVMNLTSDIFVDVSDGYTSFMVCKKDTLTRYASTFGSDPVGSTVLWNNLGNFYVGSAPYGVVSAGDNSTDWAVITSRVSHNGTSNVIEVWIDSTSVGTTGGFNYSSDSDLQSAFNRVTPLNKNDVEYAELLHYNTPLSDSDVVSVSNYLKTIHGIS